MEQGTDVWIAIASLLPIVIIFVVFAIGFGFLAKRLEKNVALWVILSLIPVVNYFFWVYAMFITLFYIIDTLKYIEKSTESNKPS